MPSSAEDGLTGYDGEAAPEMHGVLGDSRKMALGTLVSRITGFGRIAAAAAVMGPTFFGNLFQTMVILPSSLYGLLIGVMISAVMVPSLVRRKAAGDPTGVQRLAGAALGALLVVLLAVGLLCVLAAPVVVRLLTASVADPEVRRQQLRIGLPLLLMVMPQIGLLGFAGLGLAVQQAHGRFGLSAIAPAIENVVTIVVLGLSAWLYGVGADLDQIRLPQLLLLGLGTTAAAAAHAAVQWYGAWRVGVPLVPRLNWRDSELREIVRRAAASTGYTGLYWASYLVIIVMCGTVPGGVAAFQVASGMCMFPIALSAIPLGETELPRLSFRHQQQELRAFSKVYEGGLRLLMFVITPASLIAAAFPHLLAGAGAFGAMNSSFGIDLITGCLGGLAVGMIGEAAFMFTSSASYALHDTSAPFRAMALRLAVTCALAGAVRLVNPPVPHMMWLFGGSLAAANLLAGAYLCRKLRRHVPPEDKEGSGLAGALVLSAVALVPGLLLNLELGPVTALGTPLRLGWALAISGVTLGAYATLQFVRGSRELSLLLPFVACPWAVRTPRART